MKIHPDKLASLVLAFIFVAMMYAVFGMYQVANERSERITQNKKQIKALGVLVNSNSQLIKGLKKEDRTLAAEINDRKIANCETLNIRAKKLVATELIKDVETMKFFLPLPRTKAQTDFANGYILVNVAAVSKANPTIDCSPKALGLTPLPSIDENPTSPTTGVTSTSPKALGVAPTTQPLLIQLASSHPLNLNQLQRQRCVYTRLNPNVDPTGSNWLMCY